MDKIVSFNASTTRSNRWRPWWSWWRRRWNNTTATAINGKNLFIDADILNASAVAVDNRRRGTQRATGLLNSDIAFTGNRANISAFAQGANPYAIGMDNSRLYMLGCGDKVVTLNAHSRLTGRYDPSWAMRNSSLYTGHGNDIISITTSAKTVGWGNGSVATTGLENSLISTGYGNDDICLDNQAWTRRSWSTARATGMRNSVIDLGSGQNVITANVKADHERYGRLSEATVLDQSAIISGNSNDYVGLSATADNYEDRSRKNSYERKYEYNYERNYGYDRSYSYRHRWGKGSYDYSRNSSYQRSTKSQYSRESERQDGYGRSATATTLDNQSRLLTGGGNDQVFLNAFAKGGNNPGRSYYWWNNSNTNATVVDSSRIDLGMGNDILGLNSQSNGNSTGGSNALITLGQDFTCEWDKQDNDLLEISATASDIKFSSYKYSSSYETSRSSSWDSSYNRTFENSFGNIYSYSSASSGQSSSSYKRAYERERYYTLDGNAVEATGLENSMIHGGLGADAISVEAKAERTTANRYPWQDKQSAATGIKNSWIDTGSGNDWLTISAVATAQYEKTNQSSYEYERSYSYSSTSEHESSYESADGGSSSYSSSYDYDYGYSNNYSKINGYSEKDTFIGEACAVDYSTISMGMGDDTVELVSNNIVTRNSIIDMGIGNDVLTMNGTTLDAYQKSIFQGGDGNDRISLTDFSANDLDSLKSQFSFDPITRIATLGTSTFSGFEEVQLGTEIFNVATDFAKQQDPITMTPAPEIINDTQQEMPGTSAPTVMEEEQVGADLSTIATDFIEERDLLSTPSSTVLVADAQLSTPGMSSSSDIGADPMGANLPSISSDANGQGDLLSTSPSTDLI